MRFKKPKMRVCLLSSFFPSAVVSDEVKKKFDLKPGHPFPWITNLAEALAALGSCQVDVVTICNEFGGNFYYNKNGVKYNFIKSANKYRRGSTLFESDKWKIHSFLKKKAFDIVHGQGFEKYGYLAATSMLPSVVTIHLYDESPLKNFFLYDRFSILGMFLSPLKIYYQRRIKELSKYVISISPYVKQKIQTNGWKAKIFDIENAIGPSFFDSSGWRNEFFGLYIGSICDRKSTLELMEAVSKSKSVRLKIVSQTDSGEYYHKVRNSIKKLKIEDRVIFVGAKSNDELSQIIGECSFIVLPSKKETAPMVISEAMAVGKPVIATRVNGIPYMVLNGDTGFLVDVGNINQLAQKMSLLFEDDELSRTMGHKAKQEAFNRWHPEVVAVQTLRMYEKILGAR